MKFKTWEDRSAKREKIQEVFDNFMESSHQYFGSHSYAAGYISSALIAAMLDHMDEAEIATSLRHMMESTIRWQAEKIKELAE